MSEASTVGQRSEIILLTGLAGAGKSTLSEEWARSTSELAAVIDHDDVREMLRNRATTVAHGWTSEVEAHWLLARDACVAAARVYAGAAVPVLIEAFASPDDERLGWPAWRRLLEPFEVQPIVLLPDISLVEKRNRERPAPKRLEADVLACNLEVTTRWLRHEPAAVIDNTGLTPRQTLDRMMKILAGVG